MTACDITLEGGTSGRPTCLGDKSRPRAHDPFPYKILTRMGGFIDRHVVLHHSDVKEGKSDSETVPNVETLSFV